jgi:hypothetical protein
VYQRPVRQVVLPLVALVASLVVSAPASAQPAAATQPTAAASSVSAITDHIARQLASVIAQPATRAQVTSAVLASPTDLAAVKLGEQFTKSLAAANRALYAAKGLPVTAASLLRVRLGHPDMRAALSNGALPLVTAAPTDDNLTSVLAYQPAGGTILLDTASVPTQPVLVVEVDVAKALPMGAQLMTETFAAQGIRPASAGVTPTAGYWANMVNAVRLSDDKEPWIKGDAEIFSVVGGFGLDGKAKADVVQMPYLNNDGTTYYPGQLIVHYSNYKYNLADVVMMEDDGDTNYLQLAQAITTALLTIIDAGAYAPLVNAILAAMPNSWWTDDPDYVDSWYTLATTTSGRRNGAAANGWMDLSPYWVAPL